MIKNLFSLIFVKLDWLKANNLNEPFTETMQEYLKKFAEDFKFTIKLLVQWNIEAAGVLKDDPEVVNHARMCIHLQKNYLNRPSYLRKVRHRIYLFYVSYLNLQKLFRYKLILKVNPLSQ